MSNAANNLNLRGTCPDLRPVIAVIGSRAASRRGAVVAYRLAAALAERGALVISGGAVGIDAAAHAGALSVGKPTLALLGNGLDAPYPARNRALFDDIVAGGGALASPFPDGEPPLP